MMDAEDAEGRLNAALEDERRRQTGRLNALLLDIERKDRWLSVPLPDDLREHVLQERGTLAVEIGGLLVAWRTLGGTLTLVLPTMTAGTTTSPVADHVAPALAEPIVDGVDDDAAAAGASAAPVIGLGDVAGAEPLQGLSLNAPQSPSADPVRPEPLDAPPVAPLAPEAPVLPPAPPPMPVTALPAPTPRAASPAALAALQSHLADGGGFRVEGAVSSAATLVLAEAVRDLVPSRDLDGDVTRVQRAIDAREGWPQLPNEVVVRLMELVAARLRGMQAAGVDDWRVDDAFSQVTAYSQRERPGFAHGLARGHRPVTGSWDEDADGALFDLLGLLPEPTIATPKIGKRLAALEKLVAEMDSAPPEAADAVRAQVRRDVAALLADGVSARQTRLVRIVAPIAEEVLIGPEFRVQRRAAREDLEVAAADDGDDGADTTTVIPVDWPWWEATRGRRVVMVGGSPREQQRMKLEAAFGFGALAWEQAEGSRNSLQKVRDRVRAGGVDMVLLLARFVGHDADEVIQPACKEAGIAFVPVKTGYGIAGLRAAIERFVPQGVGAKG